MARFSLLLALSVVVTAPAWACGMPSGMRLANAFDQIERERALAEEARAEKLAINWVERAGEARYSSLPRELKGRHGGAIGAGPSPTRLQVGLRPATPVEAAVQPATARIATAQRTSERSTSEQVRAFFRGLLPDAEPSSVSDTGDTGDTGDAGN